ncbi:MAG: hypothetical protein ACLU1W_01305 [Collinsella sp.]
MKALVFLTALVGFVLINTVYILLVFIWKMSFNHRNVELGKWPRNCLIAADVILVAIMAAMMALSHLDSGHSSGCSPNVAPRAVSEGGPSHGDTSRNIAVRSSFAAWGTGEPSFEAASAFRGGARLIEGGACTLTSHWRTRTTRDTAQEVRQVRPARDRRVAAEQARQPVQGDVPRAHGAELRFVLDRLCTQYRPKNRHARLGGGLHAEAIMDRIVHGTVWLETGDVNMRDIYG